MEGLQIWAQPWWVNLLLLVPALSYLYWRRTGLALNRWKLLALLLFGAAFGFVEAAVVVYLRAAAGLANGSISPQHSSTSYQQALLALAQFPGGLRRIELCREAATMVMLVTVALLAGAGAKARWGAFLWEFAAWDLAYYAGLRTMLGWPSSLKDYDVLFLIPVPWVAQVWFPLLVSSLSLLTVVLCRTENATRSRVRD
jgi:hypothetical protein